MSRKRAWFLVGGLLALGLVMVYFVSLYFDPVVNYYGVRMRESQFHSYILTNAPADPDFGLYCYAQPLTNIHEQSICFDTKTELDSFLGRKYEVERQLRG